MAEKVQPLFYSIQDVTKATTLSRSEIYRRVSKGEFPAPIKLGTSRSAWLPEDILSWRDRILSEAQHV